MGTFHRYLGIAVVVLNAATAVLGLIPRSREERFWGLAALAHGGLGLQVVTGFFLFTSTMERFGILHVVFPVLALGAVLAARAMGGERRVRAVAAASLLVVAAGVYAYLTGIARGG